MKILFNKINKHKFLTIIILIVIILFGISINMKIHFNSIKQEVDENFTDFQFWATNTNVKYYDEVDSIEKLFDEAPIIAKVKMTGEKEYLNQCILSTVELINVYKNDSNLNLENKNIYIYEPVHVLQNNLTMYSTQGYIPMLKDEEYIVFLKSIKVPEGYKMSEKEKISFIYYNAKWGKYCSKGIEPYIIDEKDVNLKYEDIKNNNVILSSDDYNNLYSDYIDKINSLDN